MKKRIIKIKEKFKPFNKRIQLSFILSFLFFIFSSFTPSLVYAYSENTGSDSTELCKKPLEIQQAILDQLGDGFHCDHVIREDLETITFLQIDGSDAQGFEIDEDPSIEAGLLREPLFFSNEEKYRETLQTLLKDLPSLRELRIRLNATGYKDPKMGRKASIEKRKKKNTDFIDNIVGLKNKLDISLDFKKAGAYVNYRIHF